MPASIHIADTDYSPDKVDALREQIITIRDAALQVGDLQSAIALSHNIAILAHVRDELAAKD